MPGGEVGKSVDAVAVILGFRASILPLQIVWEPVNTADSEPRERMGGIVVLEQSWMTAIRTWDTCV
jgi:hypothetical protein